MTSGYEVAEDPVKVKVRTTEDTFENFLMGSEFDLHYVLQPQQWAHMKLLQKLTQETRSRFNVRNMI